jgi:hypothetical protein
VKGQKTERIPRLRADKDHTILMTAYQVAAFQTFFSGRISTFGDSRVSVAFSRAAI